MLTVKHQGFNNIYSFICVLTIVCGLLLSLNVLVLSFISEENQYRKSGYLVNDLQEYSFFCDDLSLSADEDDGTFNTKKQLYRYFLDKNRYMCSFRNLTEPLQKFVERKSRLRLASGQEGFRYLQCGNKNLRKPSGYLSAAFRKISRHQTYEGQGSNLVLHWDKHPKNSFISEDLMNHKGEIKVPEGGFYFLYSSVLISLTNVATYFRLPYRFILRICVRSHDYERTVLYKYKIYQQGGYNSVSSLAISGHVFIARGETVYVKVSEAKQIIINSAGNTFGMMPLR